MALSQTSVLKLYHTVIDDVIAGVRDSFLDEGVDEQVLQEMKQVWTNKLMASKAVELTIEPLEQQPPPIIANNAPKSKPNGTKSKKPSAQRENKNTANATNESNAQAAAAAAAAAANADPSSTTVATATPTPSLVAVESNTKSNQGPIVSTQQQQQQIVNKSITSQPMQTTQSNAVHQKQPPALVPTQAVLQHQQQQQAAAAAASQASTSSGAASSSSTAAAPPPHAAIIGLDPSKIVPIQITLPPLPNSPSQEPRVLEIQVPASALQENKLHSALTATPIIQSIMTLPPAVAASVLQQHINAVLASGGTPIAKQVDGTADTSDEDGSDVSDDNLDNDDEDDNMQENDEEEEEGIGAEEEPLCSDDDVSDEENQNDLFDTDNVVVCQYDKITRSRNKWKFYLKDGIMNIGGKDYIFQKSNGDAEW